MLEVWKIGLDAAAYPRAACYHDRGPQRRTEFIKWADIDLKKGASLVENADVLGHKTLAMVERSSHLVVEHKATLIERRLDQAVRCS